MRSSIPTYLGGTTSRDEGFGIAVDSAGEAYVTGAALTSDFPTKNVTGSGDFPVKNAFQETYHKNDDALVTKISAK